MTKRTEKAPGRQAGSEAPGTLGDVLSPLIAGMTATRAHLLEWVQAQGMVALQEVFAAEAEALAGPKGKHQVDRSHHHWGRTGTEVTLGGDGASRWCGRGCGARRGRKRSCRRWRRGRGGIR